MAKKTMEFLEENINKTLKGNKVRNKRKKQDVENELLTEDEQRDLINSIVVTNDDDLMRWNEFTTFDQNRIKDEIMLKLGEGYQPTEICKELNISLNTFHTAKRKAYSERLEEIRTRSNYDWLIDTMRLYDKIIRELISLGSEDTKFGNAKESARNIQGRVSALKGAADLKEKCIRLAKELGVIEDDMGDVEDERKLRHISDEELRKEIQDAVRGLGELQSRIDHNDFD